jgi:threonine dehydratase
MSISALRIVPTPNDFERQRIALYGRIHHTPIYLWDTPIKNSLFGSDTSISFKLELLQKTGSFKFRGALTVIDHLSEQEKKNGVVAGTGGNHGIAVAQAAKDAKVNAKIIVPKTINQYRLKAIEELNAEIVQVESIADVLDTMATIAHDENRTVIHPFENSYITLGTGTLGCELIADKPDLDIVIIPIGGGGLASGVSAAIKQISPRCKVFGVEPIGADSMSQSLKSGEPMKLKNGPKSIADSLCAPRAEPYSFSVCQKFLDDVVLIRDHEMQIAMDLLFHDLKLAVEPAGAAATAALIGPLREKCRGQKVGVIICGSNIDLETFYRLVGTKSHFDFTSMF